MTAKRLKIFVSAYACEPDLGSEIGVGWHWMLEMSKYFDLWVLTRESNRVNIERYFNINQHLNKPKFVYFDLPKRWTFWKKGLRGVRTYYVLWQHFSNRVVKRTMQENNIDIYHHLTYGNALWAVSRYGQSKTFVWGPTSAGAYTPNEFTKFYNFKSRTKEFAQRLMTNSLKYNFAYKKRCRDASVILCKTSRTLNAIPAEYRDKAVLFTDVAVKLIDTTRYKKTTTDEFVYYIAVGRLEAWRGFDLLIESFAKALVVNPHLKLDILGDGVDRARLQKLINLLNVGENVSLRGEVSIDDYYQYMVNADVVVNPTLREGAVTTAFDSMSFAKPLICINTGGYTRYFGDDYSIVLNHSERFSIIEDLKDAIITLTDRDLCAAMSKKIVEVRGEFLWENKGKEIRDLILTRVNG